MSDIFMAVPHFVISLTEGANDGLVTPSSAAWTNFRGVLKGVTNRGISHLDSVDFRRHRFTKKTMVNKVADIRDFYVGIAAELKEMGF